MTDKKNSNKSELILSKNRSMAIKSSGLVKRGLELIDRGKKRRVEVLIGDSRSEGIGDLISDFIKEKTKDKYDLKISFSHIGEEILRLAQNGEVDIFILLLNNINAGLIPTARARFEKSLQLSNKIKSTYGKPVIALSGFHGDPYATKAKQATDFFFPQPAKLDDLMEAFEKCLSMLLMKAPTSKKKQKDIVDIESKNGPPKILIVDDDESMRKVLNEFLVNHGYQAYSATTNDDALTYLKNEDIDVVITDITHPGADGLELTRRVKTLYNADVIVISGAILHKFHSPEECFDAGASAVLAKPAKVVDILDTVKNLLKKGGNRDRA